MSAYISRTRLNNYLPQRRAASGPEQFNEMTVSLFARTKQRETSGH